MHSVREWHHFYELAWLRAPWEPRSPSCLPESSQIAARELPDSSDAETHRDKETERQRDREIQRHRDTEKQRDIETERQRDRETERRRDRETERQ